MPFAEKVHTTMDSVRTVRASSVYNSHSLHSTLL